MRRDEPLNPVKIAASTYSSKKRTSRPRSVWQVCCIFIQWWILGWRLVFTKRYRKSKTLRKIVLQNGMLMTNWIFYTDLRVIRDGDECWWYPPLWSDLKHFHYRTWDQLTLPLSRYIYSGINSGGVRVDTDALSLSPSLSRDRDFI